MDRLARLAVCAALLAGGCLGPALNDCGDGFLCPADLRCAIGNGEATVCVPPKCGNGQIDLGEACDDGNNISGDGCPADCRPACGDGILDPGEACDEGPSNGIGNCAADCRSARVCGNGVTDAREACDDHNRQSHDGCSSQCTLETFGWTASEIGTPAAGPAVMGYDPPHGVVVLVDAEHRTWTWNGSWQRRHSPMIPRASPDQAAMFYYRLTQRLTLLGDLSASRYDAAVWDGAGWGAGDGGGGPQLSSYGVAYDAAREFPVVLGRSVATGEEQTWELGASWRRVLTARLERNGVPAAPSPGHAMTYDPRRGVVVLYRADGLWIYNGTDWSLQLGSAGPSSDDLLIAYDTVRDRIVLYGAFGSGAARVAQTWEWDGAQWQRKPDGPPARTQPAMTYDLLRGKVLLFGGLDAATGAPLDDTWAWDGLAWQQQDAPVPSLRSHHAAAYDARRASMVMFGGLDFRGNPLGDTWIWDGARWNPMAPAVSPPPRADHAMAYDPGTDRTVLFGGTDAAGHSLGDTWEWDGAIWRARTAVGPPARAGHAMVYDAARGGILLIGGADQSTLRSDQWAWTGDAWIELRPATLPPPRRDAALAFDGTSFRVVLFGGAGATGLLDDVWEWDGQWIERAHHSFGPQARSGHAMVFDATLRRLTLFGGHGASEDFNDAWQWSFGGTWTELSAGSPPEPRHHHAMVCDPVNARLLMFGGENSRTNALGELWTLRSSDPAVIDEACATGLDGDRDGTAGCNDRDCDAVCATCGNGACEPFESCRTCPGDCGSCHVCGDWLCDASETCASCPGDCHRCR